MLGLHITGMCDVCTAAPLCVHESVLIDVCSYTSVSTWEQGFWEEMFQCVLFWNSCPCCARTKQLMKHTSIHPRKSSDCAGSLFFSSSSSSASPPLPPPPGIYLLFPLSCLRKRSHRQQIEIEDIHISAEPSLDLSPNILSVSICLQFFKRSFPPSLPSSCSAPIGSRSCSTGRLLAPSHRSLAGAARICPHTSRSLAFCLWTDGTVKWNQGQCEGGWAQNVRKRLKCRVQTLMNAWHYV